MCAAWRFRSDQLGSLTGVSKTFFSDYHLTPVVMFCSKMEDFECSVGQIFTLEAFGFVLCLKGLSLPKFSSKNKPVFSGTCETLAPSGIILMWGKLEIQLSVFLNPGIGTTE